MSEPRGSLRGSCLCGAVRYELEPPSRFACHCHCENCRRAHGAAFVTWAGFPQAQLSFSLGEAELQHYLTDTQATRSFCRTCGSTLFYRSPRWPEEVHVAVGNLLDPLDRVPAVHVYADRAVEWCPIADALPRFGGASGTEPPSPGDS
jgi:hypothetical protein